MKDMIERLEKNWNETKKNDCFENAYFWTLVKTLKKEIVIFAILRAL
jgi:hypothetical protein